MTVEQRLDRIEQNIASLVEAQRETQVQIDQMSSRLDQFIYHTQRLFTQAGTQITQTEARVDRLETLALRLDRNYREMQSQQQEFRITTNAALEQIGSVMNYLLRNTNPDNGNP